MPCDAASYECRNEAAMNKLKGFRLAAVIFTTLFFGPGILYAQRSDRRRCAPLARRVLSESARVQRLAQPSPERAAVCPPARPLLTIREAPSRTALGALVAHPCPDSNCLIRCPALA